MTGAGGDIVDCDVLVVGSGAAALAAALRAATSGLKVLVLEKSDKLGGTSAMSGAGTWIPANHHALAKGVDDDADQALAYIEAVSPDDWKAEEGPLWSAFVEAAPRMLRFLEDRTPIRFELLSEPDPVLEAPGGKKFGRMLSPAPLKKSVAGPFARRIRKSTQPHDLTYEEMIWADFIHRPVRAYARNGLKILGRKARGLVTQGSALVAGLLRGCLDAGCDIRPGVPVIELTVGPDGGVTGALADVGGRWLQVRAARGVVLATGGFEWDLKRYARHFPADRDFVCSPDTNTGDGQRMAEAVGARLARMDQMNVAGALPTRYEGKVHGMPLRFQAARHAIVVDATGRRFGNEYDFNFGEKLLERDPETGRPLRLPAWVIADGEFLDNMPVVTTFARNKRGWLVKAPTIEALAAKIGVPPLALAETVTRFNRHDAEGVDAEFGRGQSGFDRLVSGKRGSLGAVARPPFAAMPFNVSLMGTKGGPRTDARGRVLREDGSAIAGLFAAGNVMANPFGTRAVGTGTTIGPCLTWGFICGETLLTEKA
ncbi:MAG: FAD-dependent oxidoreductase [Caulobacter sp.]|nr:FAD-dependent oxidoreductase [Caulobacter sp.]